MIMIKIMVINVVAVVNVIVETLLILIDITKRLIVSIMMELLSILINVTSSK